MQTFSFSPRIKLKRSYHTNYDSSFYQFHQLEFFICTSILVFKHILYTTMPYISNAKIDYNFISPSFQYTQLQYFCPQIPQQRAGYSTSSPQFARRRCTVSPSPSRLCLSILRAPRACSFKLQRAQRHPPAPGPQRRRLSSRGAGIRARSRRLRHQSGASLYVLRRPTTGLAS